MQANEVVTRGSPSRRPPDFLLVGHPKCGTTSLYEMLRRHPSLYFPALKEPMFLATDLQRRSNFELAGHLPTTVEEYLELFGDASDDQLVGEASAFYLLSQTAASMVSGLNPNARVIAVFREPSSFLYSFHLELLKHHVENQHSLRRALALEPDRRLSHHIPRRADRPSLLLYSDHIKYTDQLQRYHKELGEEQVLPLIYDDLLMDNTGTVKRILEFLGVASDVVLNPTQTNVTTRMTRHQSLDNIVRRVSVGYGWQARTIRTTLKTIVPRRPRRWLFELVASHLVRRPVRPADEEVMREIRSRFRPEVERFGDYLDRDLINLWGY